MSARIAAAVLLLPVAAGAHAGEPLEPHDLLTTQAWVLSPQILAPLILAALLYWRGNRQGRGIRMWEARSYWTGWVMLAVALVSPLHAMGEVLFSAHMAQHELMMLLAAPLLVLGRPLVPYLWGLPAPWRRPVARPFTARSVQRVWRWVSDPFHAWWLHGFALWVWHVPLLYQATVSSDLVHTLQHLSFLLSALLFWWSLLRNPRTHGQYGLAAMYVFGTALHSSILGALLTFAPVVWYPVYSKSTWAWGLTPLEDQQIGGLIMWVPAGLLYTVAGLALIAAWLRESDARTSASIPPPMGQPARSAVRAENRGIALLVIVMTAATVSSCTLSERALGAELTGGDASRSPGLIGYYGCGSCHEIPGVRGADGLIGPPRGGIAIRSYIAGVLPNTSENMRRWIRGPQEVDEHTIMPDMNGTVQDARDIAAYLLHPAIQPLTGMTGLGRTNAVPGSIH